jgi:hypothetical protein
MIVFGCLWIMHNKAGERDKMIRALIIESKIEEKSKVDDGIMPMRAYARAL